MMNMKRVGVFLSWLTVQLFFFAATAVAVPETVSVLVADVTTASFSVVWMTDVAADADVEVYADGAMVTRLTDGIGITAMPDAPQAVAAAAKNKGVMKVRVSGLQPNSRYFVRTVTRDPSNPASVSYSELMAVTTAREVVPHRTAVDGSLPAYVNDLLTMRVFVRPNDAAESPGLGNLLVLNGPAGPVTAFVGVGTVAPEGVLDLNNLFGEDLKSYAVQGGEKILLSIYRGGTLASLSHYRLLAAPTNTIDATEPLRGFFADINLDGRVDRLDYEEFRKQFRTAPHDNNYNPDFDFFADPDGKVDARDFARFAREYGKTAVK